LASSNRDDAYLDPGFLGEEGQDVLEQTGVLGGGSRLDDDEVVVRAGAKGASPRSKRLKTASFR
jgi:hypothetical protein